MPSRGDYSTISVGKNLKAQLEEYKGSEDSWDSILAGMLEVMKKEGYRAVRKIRRVES